MVNIYQLVFRPLLLISDIFRRVNGRLRGMRTTIRLKAIGAHVGKGLSVARNVQIVTVRGAKWHIGNNVSLGNGVNISVADKATLNIGNDVRITHYTIIGAEDCILIQDRTQIGEHCSIRDHEHDATAPSMHAAPLTCSAIRIGEDSWIGRGVAVLKGSCIGPGAVVGANAVVRGEIPPGGIAVGIPARVIRTRRGFG